MHINAIKKINKSFIYNKFYNFLRRKYLSIISTRERDKAKMEDTDTAFKIQFEIQQWGKHISFHRKCFI